MTANYFINKTDALGGLYEMYKAGYTPEELDVDADPALYAILMDAWKALSDFFSAQDDYYTYCEDCGQEQ